MSGGSAALQRLANVSRELDDRTATRRSVSALSRGRKGSAGSKRGCCSMRQAMIGLVVTGCASLYGAFLLRASQKHQSLLAQQSLTEEGENDFFSRPLRRAGGGFAAVTHASADALHKVRSRFRSKSKQAPHADSAQPDPDGGLIVAIPPPPPIRWPEDTSGTEQAQSDTAQMKSTQKTTVAASEKDHPITSKVSKRVLWNGEQRFTQLKSFLDHSSEVDSIEASTCDKDYVGWELFSNWRKMRESWCTPRAEAPGSVVRSEVGCAGINVPNHGKRFVCDARNVGVRWASAVGSPGGEEVDSVMGQQESLELYKYTQGFFKAQCDITRNSNNVEGIQPPAKDWLANGVMQSVKSDADMDCASWMEEPVVVVSRVEFANFYHTMTDFVGAWSALVIAGVDPRDVRVVFADGHPKSPFDGAWGKIFSKGKPPLRKGEMDSKGVCLRRAVFALYGYSSPMTIDWFRANPCKSSAWLGAFSRQVLEAFDLQAPTPTPFSLTADSPPANLTLVLREDYVAHPRDAGGGKRHNKISNPEQLQTAMQNIPGTSARTVRMAFLSFEEQIKLIRSTNVLIGMHGAGMTFLPFLADDAVVVELVPQSGMKKFHFQNLAAWSDKGYILWRNSIIGNEIDAMNTRVDPGQFTGLVEGAVKMLKHRAI